MNKQKPFEPVAITQAVIKCIKFVEIPGIPEWRARYRSKWRYIPNVISESEKFRRKNSQLGTCCGLKRKYPNGFFPVTISEVHRNASVADSAGFDVLYIKNVKLARFGGLNGPFRVFDE
ncbi:hypothetical protein WA026_023159 [Henosepilachna vigintioctopunctata]|uniref:Uncharacterized protein n=1 Tax=Henosepilachna vigintioctopunctata TaxID=420089 RepID=A0AAW1TZR8_9CUCU